VRKRCPLLKLAAAAIAFVICGSSTSAAPKQAHQHPKTALAAYQKQVIDRIGQRWYVATTKAADSIAVGVLKMSFRIESDGRVTNLQVTSNSSNQTFARICVAAVLESRFPPMSDAVKRELHHDFLEWHDMNFTMYLN
jgi:outer membrane biosynthesis protein TonB